MCAEANAGALRVLVVENEGLQAEELALLMGEWGHRVAASVADVESALRAIDTQEIDLAIIDLELDGNGFGGDVVEYLERQQGAPSVVLSGRLTALNHGAVASLGVAAVLPKPCSYDALRDVIDGLARQAGRSAA